MKVRITDELGIEEVIEFNLCYKSALDQLLEFNESKYKTNLKRMDFDHDNQQLVCNEKTFQAWKELGGILERTIYCREILERKYQPSYIDKVLQYEKDLRNIDTIEEQILSAKNMLENFHELSKEYDIWIEWSKE